MDTTSTSPIDRALRHYNDDVEAWRRDHVAAMECRDLDDLLAIGNLLFERIDSRDRRRRESVDRGESPNDWRVDLAHAALYRRWAAPCQAVLDELARFEATGFEVEGAELFRANCRAARRRFVGDASTNRPRPVDVDDRGRIFDVETKQRVAATGLEPDRVLQSLADAEAGRLRTFQDVMDELARDEP